MNGLVMHIQRFSLQDGPGIRTSVFLQGCNLRCRWCHNPESWQAVPHMLFYEGRCARCGACAPLCGRGAHTLDADGHRLDVRLCAGCPGQAHCAAACPAQAMVRCGTWYTPEALLAEIERDRVFYGSDGGVTFSGGEALLQSAFLIEALRACRAAGLHTCVDTAAHVPAEVVRAVAPHSDLFLVDLKAMDAALHHALTGVRNTDILENIALLHALGKPMRIRMPLIHGTNDTPEALGAAARFLARLDTIEQIDLFPVLNHAGDKYRAMGREAERFNEDAGYDAMVARAMETMRASAPTLPPLTNLMRADNNQR